MKGKLKVSVELAIAQINAEANTTISNDQEKLLEKTRIRIYGNLKKTIFAMSMLDLIGELKQLVNNPDEYLVSAPISYSVLPLSSFLNRDAVVFTEGLQVEQLDKIYQMRLSFDDSLRNINTLKKFSHDISGKNMDGTSDIPDVMGDLNDIKHTYQSLFLDLQNEWVDIMERKVIQNKSF